MKRQMVFEYVSEAGGRESVDIRQTDKGRVCYTLLHQAGGRLPRGADGLVMLRLVSGGRGKVKFYTPQGERLTVKY